MSAFSGRCCQTSENLECSSVHHLIRLDFCKVESKQAFELVVVEDWLVHRQYVIRVLGCDSSEASAVHERASAESNSRQVVVSQEKTVGPSFSLARKCIVLHIH